VNRTNLNLPKRRPAEVEIRDFEAFDHFSAQLLRFCHTICLFS
jgi:hypothetical protein